MALEVYDDTADNLLGIGQWEEPYHPGTIWDAARAISNSISNRGLWPSQWVGALNRADQIVEDYVGGRNQEVVPYRSQISNPNRIEAAAAAVAELTSKRRIFGSQRTATMPYGYARTRRYGYRRGMGYNRRFGAGKYRRAPRVNVGRGWRNNGNEKKYFDIMLPVSNINYTTGGVGNALEFNNADPATSHVCLNNMPQGMDATQRIGRKVKMNKLTLRGAIEAGNASQAPYVARLLVVYDKCPNGGGVPNANTVVDVSVTGMSYATAGMALANRERFKILMDKIVTIPARVTAASVPTNQCDTSYRMINKTFRLKGLPVVYNNANTSLADAAPGTAIQSGAIFMYCLGDAPTTAGFAPYFISGISRLRYFDA